MTKREKLLAVAVSVVVCLWGGNWLWNKYSRSLAAKRTELITARQRMVEAKVALNQGQAAVTHLDAWQERSLPADRETAQSVYRVWLENQCKAAGLVVQQFRTSSNLVPTAGYSPVGYTDHRPRHAQIADQFSGRLLSQSAAAADHADAPAARGRRGATEHRLDDRGPQSAWHFERNAAGGRRRAAREDASGGIRGVNRRTQFVCRLSTAAAGAAADRRSIRPPAAAEVR